MLAKIAAKKVFFSEKRKVKKQIYKIGSIDDRADKVWLGCSRILKLWPSISTGLSRGEK